MNGPDNLLDISLETALLPEVRNHTRFPSQYFQMLDVADTVFHVMVSRLTYDLNDLDEQWIPRLAEVQHPLVEADEYYGETAASSMIQESDYAPFKPRCDVLFTHAVAHAPGGKALPGWKIGVRVGEWQKMLTVTGPRKMAASLTGWRIDAPQPVTQVPLRYELAWGGTCQWPLTLPEEAEPEILKRLPENPIGTGFVDPAWQRKSKAFSVAAPQIEAPDQPFNSLAASRQDYPVAGLGAIGRSWQPRLAFAGTYDQAWKETRWPRLPLDFEFDYWNAAPTDQQIPYPAGGEEVVIAGLHPEGKLHFRLPDPGLKLLLRLDAGIPAFKPMLTDTLIFDMRAMELTIVQRATVPAQAGVRNLEVGTWDIEAARRANAARMA